MDMDYFGQLETQLDELRTRVKLLEEALVKIPFIDMQADPSRPAGVMVEPTAPLKESA